MDYVGAQRQQGHLFLSADLAAPPALNPKPLLSFMTRVGKFPCSALQDRGEMSKHPLALLVLTEWNKSLCCVPQPRMARSGEPQGKDLLFCSTTEI